MILLDYRQIVPCHKTTRDLRVADMNYQLEGKILEVCDCKVLCPCWIGEDADNGSCDTVVAYHIGRGTVDGTDDSKSCELPTHSTSFACKAVRPIGTSFFEGSYRRCGREARSRRLARTRLVAVARTAAT